MKIAKKFDHYFVVQILNSKAIAKFVLLLPLESLEISSKPKLLINKSMEEEEGWLSGYIKFQIFSAKKFSLLIRFEKRKTKFGKAETSAFSMTPYQSMTSNS